MIIRINGDVLLDTKHTLNEIAKLIQNKIIDVSEDNVIHWGNVFSVEVKE